MCIDSKRNIFPGSILKIVYCMATKYFSTSLGNKDFMNTKPEKVFIKVFDGLVSLNSSMKHDAANIISVLFLPTNTILKSD